MRETFYHALKALANITTKMFGIAKNLVSFITWHRQGLFQKHSCPVRRKTRKESPVSLAPVQPVHNNFQCYLLGSLNMEDVSSTKLQEAVKGS